ncbi:MAG: tetratricopeptide repeat protein [Magnetococcales bacterium]|nr:tetratricopeptide repeat protein [Magnetococcales bacterium]
MRQFFCNIALFISLLFVGANAWADDVDDLLNKGANSLVGEDIQQAINYFNLAIQPGIATHLQMVSAYSGLCASRYKISLIKKDSKLNLQAIQDCDKAIFLKSDQQSVYRMRGIAYLTYGNFEKAVSDLNVAVALEPSDFLSIQNRGLAKARLGSYDDAIVDFDRAIELKPSNPWGYYNRGRIQAILSNYEQAVDDFSAFIRFNRKFALVYMHRGRSRLRLGHYQQAVGDFYEAIRIEKGDKSIAIAHRGITLYMLGRFDEAAVDLAKVVKLNPKDMESRFWLYLVRTRLGQPKNSTFTANGGVTKRGTWAGEMSAYLMGHGESHKVLDMVRATKDDVIRGERESLSNFIFGEWAAVQGKLDVASKWFEIIVNKKGLKPPWFHSAKQQLALLQNQKNVMRSAAEQEKLAEKVVAVFKEAQQKNDKKIAVDKVKEIDQKRDKVKLTLQRHLTKLPKQQVYNSAATPDKKGYVFKLASFGQLTNAQKALEEAKLMGYKANIQSIMVKGNRFMRVWIGPFSDLQKANEARDLLKQLPGRSPGKVQFR